MKKFPSASIPKFVDKLKLPADEVAAIKQQLTVLSSSQRTDVPAKAVPGEHAQSAMSNFDSTVGGAVTRVFNATEVAPNGTPEAQSASPAPTGTSITPWAMMSRGKSPEGQQAAYA